MTKLEEVAWAIATTMGCAPEECDEIARAAIGAMREPTEAMVRAVTLDTDIQGVNYLRGPAVWTTMIDEILKEQPCPPT